MSTPAPSPVFGLLPLPPRCSIFSSMDNASRRFWLVFEPLMFATNPIPHASCSSSGVYKPRLVFSFIVWLFKIVIFSQSRAERGFEFIKQTEGNWEFVPLLRNFLNLFRNISNCFKIDNASTIALRPILKIFIRTRKRLRFRKLQLTGVRLNERADLTALTISFFPGGPGSVSTYSPNVFRSLFKLTFGTIRNKYGILPSSLLQFFEELATSIVQVACSEQMHQSKLDRMN